MSTSFQRAALVSAVCVLFLASSGLALKGHKKERKPFGLIFGTVYGPDDRPVYGVKVLIHPVGRKKPKWELMSDHRGEFAQRVPLDPADYEVTGEAEIMPMVNGKPQRSLKKRVQDVVRVHVEASVEKDISLHLRE